MLLITLNICFDYWKGMFFLLQGQKLQFIFCSGSCGIDINNKKEYNSAFNIINSADLISYVAQIEYGITASL